jgi:Tol biopolymer transport system component
MRKAWLVGAVALTAVAVTASASPRATAPPAGQIAFARDPCINLIPATGGTPKRLVKGEYPSYIGGGKLLYESGGDLYTVKVDGTGVTRLTRGLGAQHPTLSPDGKTIAYSGPASSDPDVGVTIWFIGVDGKGKRERTTWEGIAPGGDKWPAWSPDGRTVVYVHGHTGDPPEEVTYFDLRAVTVGGKTKPRLIDPDIGSDAPENCCHERKPAWAPSATIYYPDNGRISSIRPDKTGLRRISPGPNDTAPAFGPGGRWFAFVRQSGTRAGVYVMDAVTKQQIRLTKYGFPSPYDAAWIPAG